MLQNVIAGLYSKNMISCFFFFLEETAEQDLGMTAPSHIPVSDIQVIQFFHVLTNIWYYQFSFVHSDACGGFHLYFLNG